MSQAAAYAALQYRRFSHEVFYRRIDGSSEPGCGVAALSFSRFSSPTLLVILAVPPAAMAAEPAIQLLGRGVQIYACEKVGPAYTWHLKGPDATLTDSAGDVAGHHFAGPTWQANDGSTVVGSVLTASPAPQPGAVPWLVLAAKSHTGAGRFSHIGYVVRSQTKGGVAPASGCDPAHGAAEVRVAYQATYVMFPAADSH